MRAYLGASRPDREQDPAFNAFTGFNPHDDMPVWKLCTTKPLHVLNMALNLVHGSRLAWQERKAESFTVTALHCGNADVGYRPSEEYGGGRPTRRKSSKDNAITLGTALATSGAAANPNMGYHTSSAVAFVMTLFNVRMGIWLGNPGKAGGNPCFPTYGRSSPRFSIGPLVQEALGLTTNEKPYVNLSDGGHFENLGIYEMVRRRCRWIIAIDAGADNDCGFEDLGNAVRKIQIDLGVQIKFDKISIYPREPKPQPAGGGYVALGTIRYTDPITGNEAEPGCLLYIKPAIYGTEPIDIYNYAQRCPQFPHESTANQFFTESQFESYRSLGGYVFQTITGPAGGQPGFQALFQAASKVLSDQIGKTVSLTCLPKPSASSVSQQAIPS
jgi:hypothetical protein